VIETSTRRGRTADDTRDRLTRLISQAHVEPKQDTAELPPDQEWVDVSADPPDPPPRLPWWRRGRVGRLLADWVPEIPEVRVVGRRRLVAAVVGAFVLAVLVAVSVAMSSRGEEHETPPVLPMAAAATSATSDRSIVVSVVGRVARPGLVTLPDGARVADALRESGGPVPETELGALNLARRLSDGEQIYVGVQPPPGAEPAPVAPGPSAVPDKVDLNTATLAALDTLPGVGPVTAQRIVDWRTEHGHFDSVEQLREIDGIGPSRFTKLKDLVVAR
jgi:competence protein ComEA